MSWALRIASVLVPLLAGVGTGLFLAARLPSPVTAIQVVGWWLLVFGASLFVTVGIDRFSRRLLPLAALYRMTLAFPDKAPSRLLRRLHGPGAQPGRSSQTARPAA